MHISSSSSNQMLQIRSTKMLQKIYERIEKVLDAMQGQRWAEVRSRALHSTEYYDDKDGIDRRSYEPVLCSMNKWLQQPKSLHGDVRTDHAT